MTTVCINAINKVSFKVHFGSIQDKQHHLADNKDIVKHNISDIIKDNMCHEGVQGGGYNM